jgi:hypothetical protein
MSRSGNGKKGPKRRSGARPNSAEFGEGTLFCVPLKRGGYALGLIARRSMGVLLCYFFGTRFRQLPGLSELSELRQNDALRVWRVQDGELRDGHWLIIGKLEVFHRTDWPVPQFVYQSPISPFCVEVRQHSEDLMNVKVRRVKGVEAERALRELEHDCLMGRYDPAAELDVLLEGIPKTLTCAPTACGDALCLLRSHSNPNSVHEVVHYLYVPTQAAAKRLLAKLRKLGFKAKMRLGADDENWLVLASHQVVPTDMTFDNADQLMKKLAKGESGEYDGWETGIEK